MLDGGRIDPTQQDGARVPDPAQQAGLAFAKLLGLGRALWSAGTAPPDAEVLGTVVSAPVAELVETLLQKSDNVLAEVLARETAIARGGEPSFDGAVRGRDGRAHPGGHPTTGAAMVDGSGLSTAGPGARRSCWRRWWRRPPRPPGPGRHRVPAAGAHRAAGGGRRRHARRPVRAGPRTRRRGAGSCARRPAPSRRRAASRASSSTRTSGCSCSRSCRTAALPPRTRPKLDDLRRRAVAVPLIADSGSATSLLERRAGVRGSDA